MTKQPAEDLFKETFKRYKKKNADLSDTIDLSRPTPVGPEVSEPTNSAECSF